jgi:hypothetical protein
MILCTLDLMCIVCVLKKRNKGALAVWSSGIISACHRGDWSYGSGDRILAGYTLGGSFKGKINKGNCPPPHPQFLMCLSNVIGRYVILSSTFQLRAG